VLWVITAGIGANFPFLFISLTNWTNTCYEQVITFLKAMLKMLSNQDVLKLSFGVIGGI
jgi:hypothetical protein